MLFKKITYYSIPINLINSIEEANWTKFGIFSLKLGNKIAWHCILITKKTGLIRKVVITPDHPKQFIQDIENLKNNPIDINKK